MMETQNESTSGMVTEEESIQSRAANLLAKFDPDTFGSPVVDNSDEEEEETGERVDDQDVETTEDEDFPLADEDDLDAGEKDEDELPDEEPGMELDEELAKNPKLKKRWDDHLKGLRKEQNKVETLKGEMGNFHTLMKALENPQSVEKAFDFLAEQLGQLHGIDLKRSAQTIDNDGLEEWERKGYQSPGEYRAALEGETARKELEKMKREIAPELEEVRRLRQETANRTAQEALGRKIAKATPAIASRVSVEENGFPVTEEMVRKAYDAFPNHRSSKEKMAEAVAMLYRKEIKQHHLQKAEAKTQKRSSVGDMTKGGKALKGTHMKAEDVTMDDIIQSIRAKFQ